MSRIIPLLGTATIVATTALLLYAGAGGVRGSDQYWYLADAETLAHDHAVRTNNVFPVTLLSPGATLPPPFTHNVLSIYLAAAFAILLGGFWGWLTLNLVATFATAGLIWLAARRAASPLAAAVAALAYPLLPNTFWQTAQPAAEASIALFAALTMYTVAVAGASAWRWVLVVIAAGLLYLSRESYLPLLIIVPIGFLLVRVTEHRGAVRQALAPALGLAGVAAAVAYLAQTFLFAKSNVEFGYTRLLHTAVPGRTFNMWYNFDLSAENLENRLPFDAELLLLKLKANLAQQFVDFSNPAEAAIYWTFNLLVVVALAAAWRCRRQPLPRRLALAALAPVGIHLLTITLFQNQFRYVLPAIPGLLVAFAIAVGTGAPLLRMIARRLVIVAILLVLFALPVNAALARILHAQGMEERRIRLAAESVIGERLQPHERLLVLHTKGYQLFAYAARPRLVLFFDSRHTAAEARRLLAAFNSRYLLAPKHSRVIAMLKAVAIEGAAPISAFERTWRLYRVADK